MSFAPAISTKAAKSIRTKIRQWKLASTRNNQSLEDLAQLVNPCGPWLDELLRAVLSLAVCSGPPVPQQGAGYMGAAEVQTAATSPACFSPLAGAHRAAEPDAIRAVDPRGVAGGRVVRAG